MEVIRHGRVETQTCHALGAGIDGVGQPDPLLRRRIAHNVMEVVLAFPAAAEEEAVAAGQQEDALVLRQEIEERRDQRAACPGDVGETGSWRGLALGHVEETLEGLGQLPAVVRVRDGALPGPGDAHAAAERLDGETGEDLDEEVVGEASHRPHLEQKSET